MTPGAGSNSFPLLLSLTEVKILNQKAFSRLRHAWPTLPSGSLWALCQGFSRKGSHWGTLKMCWGYEEIAGGSGFNLGK